MNDYEKPKPVGYAVTPDKLKSLLREPVECQHESEGTTHWSAEYDDYVYICTKCGEFYK